MSKSFLPRTDAGLLDWSNNIVARMGPDASVYGVPAAQYTAYAALHATYAAAYAAAQEPLTRTKGTIQAKNDAARLLRRDGRSHQAGSIRSISPPPASCGTGTWSG